MLNYAVLCFHIVSDYVMLCCVMLLCLLCVTLR